ncbi:MAG: flagellar basal body L-ring protein FlgH, partial [Geminicoccales bacterium]
PNSLWRTGSRAFFKDQRASNVGDIVTIVVNIDDNATLRNTSARSRTNMENAAADAFLGYEQSLHQLLPEAVDPTNLVELNSRTNNEGAGEISRDEAIEVKVAAVVTQILPNGNLVVQGRQEVRVNYEIRELEVAGVIRPQDITSDNTISSDKIAEARIAYGGRGHISDVQQPRYGQQVYDVLFPF